MVDGGTPVKRGTLQSSITVVISSCILAILALLVWPYAPSRTVDPTVIQKPEAPNKTIQRNSKSGMEAIALPPPPNIKKVYPSNKPIHPEQAPSHVTGVPKKFANPLQPKISEATSFSPEPLKPLEGRSQVLPKGILQQTPLLQTLSPRSNGKDDPSKSDGSVATILSQSTTVHKGRTLLRILEHGDGPEIQIAWPKKSSQRDRLFDVLVRCYGLRVALMGGKGRVYIARGSRGQPWAINLDKLSGFVRQTTGEQPSAERSQLTSIRNYHQMLFKGIPVRMYPRRTDAHLLGHLRALVGNTYQNSKQIQAHYRLEGNKPMVEHIEVDGRRVAGKIYLLKHGRKCS